jgi:hypothetical protein
MSTANLDSADLKAVARGGLIREDVMNKIFDISRIPLPFTDMIGSESSSNSYKEWTVDALQQSDVSNAVVDGADASGNDTATGGRIGNHHQIAQKVVKVSFRADASNVIGRAKELAYQLSRRQQELRRDVEAILLKNQASAADNGDSIPGNSAGLPAWIRSNQASGYGFGAGGAVGGFNAGTGLVAARTPSTAARALTETFVRDAVQDVYLQGGDPSIFMATPMVIRKLSEYMFTSSARVATLYSDTEGAKSAAVAMGSVNVFVTDFGTLKMVPNRLQPFEPIGSSLTTGLTAGVIYVVNAVGASSLAQWQAAGWPGNSLPKAGQWFRAAATSIVGGGSVRLATSNGFVLDPEYLAVSYLKGYRTEELAKMGLAENRQMSVDFTLIVNNERAHALIGDIDHLANVTA